MGLPQHDTLCISEIRMQQHQMLQKFRKQPRRGPRQYYLNSKKSF